MEWLFTWLSHYGYAGLFCLLLLGIVGLPIPDETLLVFCGYLIWRGRLHCELTFLAGFAGSVCGISMSYFIGRRFGRKFIHRYGRYFRMTNEHMHRVSRWFHRIGAWVLSVGYFVPGIRHFTALVAGMSHLRYPTFAVFAYPGAAVWVTTFLTLGYFGGEQWEHTSTVFHRYIIGITLVGAALLAVTWWVRNKQIQRK
jgi:membrane protein DedA with SNARE-associated domain